MKNSPVTPVVSSARRVITRVTLLACLVQILLFYVGLIQTTRRIAALWGKDLEERRTMLFPLHAFLKRTADQFPMNARIYILLFPSDSQKFYPSNQHLHILANNNFYPRVISISMTNAAYRTEKEYDPGNEIPDEQWLITNRFTHVITFKNPGRVWVVHPGVGREIADWVSANVNG